MTLAEALSRIEDIKHRATIACVSYPAQWIAIQGISLVEYNKQLDELAGVLKVLDEKGLFEKFFETDSRVKEILK